ncbi:spermidine/putrescine ABC transporter substrate-binding protein [Microbacterium excoecariae]|uniref:spermidine/putrescine ABC transporter substrate-binding protein n=1 Tax=Microbacterium excoecariae TaxID=2715210 RepID=UPI0014073136|nr:spermidine/putrescine ABC transporter substrate-binding protein [Microbacterium excoecariae]NHI15582.1 spermidine/putrescine ABC transporter substrate-binding protein [Microbacterium excoecariae]
MERSLETRVSQAVDAWLRWLPRWEPATHRGRRSPCRRCLGSPLLAAAGLEGDTPHGVQHGLTTRLTTLVDQRVAGYTAANLPLLQTELDQQAARNRARSYRPRDGLDPEFDGMPLDPDPDPSQPFLFTIAGFEEEAAREAPPLPPLTEAAKQALRREVALADEHADAVGREICHLLGPHRRRIRAAIVEFVDPQVDRLLAELGASLDAPFDPRDLGG